jgi:hypothetical protein
MKGLQPNVTDIDYYIRSRSIFLRQSWVELFETVSSRLDCSVCCEVREVMNDVVRHVQDSLSSDKNPGRSQSNVLINPTLPWQPPRAYEYTDNSVGFDSSLIISAEIAFTNPLIDTYRAWD